MAVVRYTCESCNTVNRELELPSLPPGQSADDWSQSVAARVNDDHKRRSVDCEKSIVPNFSVVSA